MNTINYQSIILLQNRQSKQNTYNEEDILRIYLFNFFMLNFKTMETGVIQHSNSLIYAGMTLTLIILLGN